MKLAIITDSTCDLSQKELEALNVYRVPLYVNFKGHIFKDWLEINPKDIVEGVESGANMPSTSQPNPQDFENAYKAVIAKGADEILCITISSDLSGTFQSANIAKEASSVPVSVFDSRAASLGIGSMIKKAAELRDQNASLEEITTALEQIRDSNMALFTVASLDFLQKNGRIGGAQALVGSLLNIKPILGLIGDAGQIEPIGRARGNKKALKELVNQIKTYKERHSGKLFAHFIYIQDSSAVDKLKAALEEEDIQFEDRGTYEIGAVITSHVGPGTYGIYMHTEA